MARRLVLLALCACPVVALADAPDAGPSAPTAPAPTAHDEPDDTGPVTRVVVGVYVNQIRGLSLREHSYEVDFWIWFRWEGEAVDPLASFELIGGRIDAKEGEVRTELGRTHYAAVRVTGTITQHFDVSRFPLDDHVISLRVEDTENESHKLVFAPDRANSRIDPDVQVAGWVIDEARAIVTDHSYRTNYGDTSLPSNNRSEYSRFAYEIQLERRGSGYVFKLFWGVWLATLIALLAFFIKPTDLDPRFGLGIGAIFAAMASAYIISSSLPETNQMTIADQLNMLAIAYIFLSLVGSTISLKLYNADRQAASAKLDRGSFWFLLVSYATCNVMALL